MPKTDKSERSMVYKDDFHEYAMVTRKLGNGNFTVKLNMEEKERIGHLCGKLRNKKHGIKQNNFVEVGSLVLVGLRDYQENKVDIVHVYNQSETRDLLNNGDYIQDSSVQMKNNEPDENQDAGFDFTTI